VCWCASTARIARVSGDGRGGKGGYGLGVGVMAPLAPPPPPPNIYIERANGLPPRRPISNPNPLCDLASIKFHAISAILLTWQDHYKEREWESFIPVKPNRHSYLVCSLGNYALALFPFCHHP
jgi:hypothetical protein